MPEPPFTLHTLGELRLNGPAGPVLAGRRKELVLLTFIARRAPRPVTRDELAALLWGERDEDKARQSLRHALHQLRRALGDAIEVTNEQVRTVDGLIELDACLLERDVADARLAQAVERWGGEFLRGTEDAGDDTFRSWLEQERESIRRAMLAALSRLVSDAQSARTIGDELRWARRWAELFPHDESAHVRLIDALRRSGDVAAGRGVHASFAARQRELDVPPSVEFIRLGDEISRATPEERQRRAGTGALQTPELVGRGAAILASLAELWSRVRTEGNTAVIEGDEGTGKSRLCAELIRRVRAGGQSCVVLQTRASDDDRAMEYATFRRLMSSLVTASVIEDAPNKALSELSDALPSVRDRFPHLAPASGQTDRTEQALRDVVRAVAAEAPILLVIDDVGCADSRTLALLRSLVTALPRGAMIVMTLRPDRASETALAAELGELAGVRRFKLAALERPEVASLIDSMLEIEPAARDALADRLYAETRGNPLRITSLVSTLADTGELILTTSGVWQLAPGFPSRALGAEPVAPRLVDAPRAYRARRWALAAVGVAVAVALTVAASVLFSRRVRPESTDRRADADTAPRVAVADLELLTRDSLDAHLASGLAEEINSSLSRLEDLRIKSRGAVRTAREAGIVDPVQLGRTLQVDYVVEGSVRRVGDALKVAVRLTKTSDGFTLWSDDFDATGALPALHDRIAREVASRIGTRLTRGALSSLTRPLTSDAQAYEHYLRGNYYLARRTPQTVEQAIAQYRVAVARDSSFAAARARIGYAYALLLDWGWARGSRSADDLLHEGLALTESALTLDSLSADAWMARAYLLATADPVRMTGAASAFERAITLNPRSAEAIHQYAQIHQAQGNWDEALAAFRRTLVLEPDRSLPYVSMASILWKQGKPREARRLYDSALVVDPGAAYALSARALLKIFAENDVQGALEDAETAVRVEEGYSIPPHSVLAVVLARSGARGRAELEVDRALSEIVDPSAPSPTDARWLASALLAVGRRDEALSLIERARPRGGWMWFYFLATDFDPIRSDPRFVRVMRDAKPDQPTDQKR